MPDKASNIKINNGLAALYQGKAAVLKQPSKRRHGEGAVSRAVRLVKGIKEVKASFDTREYASAEDKRKAYREVFHDTCAPVYDAVHNMADTLWSFLYKLWYDFLDVIVFIINMIVKGAYYVGSFAIFLWDKLWDLRLWADARKKTLFQIFFTLIAVVVLGFITVNYLTAYEYSYYGRVLGVAKTKQDVYSTIELMGDKLSENAGVNVNFDVERDIQFKQVFGLNNKIDTKDDILNTLTYMKDIHVNAYAVQIDGVDIVVLDNEAAAKSIIEDVKSSLTPKIDGFECEETSVEQDITIAETNVTLGDLWRPDDAAKYLKTGFVRDLEEGEEAQPMITVHATGTLTWDEQVAYGVKYETDDSMYLNQVVLSTEGQPGLNRNTAKIETVNGVEVARTDQTVTTIYAPVDAVYRKGSKEIPASSGPGTWLFPLKASYILTSGFGG